MEFQESEIVSLAVSVAFVGSLAFLQRVIRLPRLPVIYAAMFTLMGAHLFTVVEGVFAAESLASGAFNLLEHICYAASGVLFAVGCWTLARSAEREEGGQP